MSYRKTLQKRHKVIQSLDNSEVREVRQKRREWLEVRRLKLANPMKVLTARGKAK